MKNKKKNRVQQHTQEQQCQSTQVSQYPDTLAQQDARLEKSLDSCITKLASLPINELNKKQVHVGMEAVILRADRLSSKNNWTLEKADLHLQYKDTKGNTIMVNTDLDLINMKRQCQLLYGPAQPKELTVTPVAEPSKKKGKK